MRVLSIFGTRPEAIKMVPVIKELERHSDKINSIVCVTGQHREILDQVLSLFHVSLYPAIYRKIFGSFPGRRKNTRIPFQDSRTISHTFCFIRIRIISGGMSGIKRDE